MIKDQRLKKVYGVLAFISFFMMLGTVGALEHDAISFTQNIIQTSISMFCLCFFGKLAGAFEYSGNVEAVNQKEILSQINHYKPIRTHIFPAPSPP